MKNAVARILMTFSMLIVFTACTSCVAAFQYFGDGNLFRDKRRSFIKINVINNITVIKTSTTSFTEIEDDYRLQLTSAASGVIMGHYDKMTLVATSAHVCSIRFGQKINELLPEYDPNSPQWHIIERPFFALKDLNGKTTLGIVLKIDYGSDLCMIVSKKIPMPEIHISKYEPIVGEKYYNIASPKGIWAPNVVPLLEGRFTGYVNSPFTGESSYMFTIPATGGSSGSPVINLYGELVGLIHSAYSTFDHISMSATRKQLEILLAGSYSRLKKQYDTYKVILSLDI